MSQRVESRMGAVAWAIRQRSVSHPRSSNRTCRSPASGSPTGFTARYTESKLTARGFGAVSFAPRHSNLRRRLSLMVFAGSSPITFTSPSSKAHQKSGPFPQPALPGFDGHTTPSDSRHGRRLRDVEAATLALDGSPPITRTTFPTCRAHYPGGSSGCACRLLPRSCCLPLLTGGSASALGLSRSAQASLTLRPTGLLNRLKRPLSRGSSPAGYPTEPLVSYQINRQLSGWNLPPLVIRAFGAHGQKRRFDHWPFTSGLPR